MELVSPGMGLIFWQTVLLSGILLFITAWIVILMTNKLNATNKLVWLLGTLFLPIIGPLIFLLKFPFLKKPATL
jgi:hypothetical protein